MIPLYRSPSSQIALISFYDTIIGKNGTGKSTFTEEIKKMTSDYDVSVFQGFRKVGIY